jgi:uncharacterized FlgJ-related protein
MNNKIFKQNEDMSVTDISNKILTQKILLIAVCVLYFFSSFRNEVKFVDKQIIVKDTVYLTQEFKDIELTDNEVLKELIKQGCVLPNVALAQAKIESMHFKSNIARENKNIFGIRNSASNLAIGKNRGHSVYKSYKDCITDYIRVQNKYLKNINLKYATDTNYISKIKKIK